MKIIDLFIFNNAIFRNELDKKFLDLYFLNCFKSLKNKFDTLNFIVLREILTKYLNENRN